MCFHSSLFDFYINLISKNSLKQYVYIHVYENYKIHVELNITWNFSVDFAVDG